MNVQDLMSDLVAAEPAYDLRPDDALRQGRRRRTRRRAALTSALAVSLGATSLGVVALAGDGGGGPTDAVVPIAAPPAAAAPAPVQGVLERVVRAQLPDGWTVSEPVADHAVGFQAYVDDGRGAQRLYVGVSPSPGSLQQHPCSDSEFKGAGTCTETDQPDGTRLVVRGPALSGPVTSTQVVVIHPDGGGTDVGMDNARWAPEPPSGTLVTQEQKLALSLPTSITDHGPALSPAQLVALARAADATR